jgi:hypothetical protein
MGALFWPSRPWRIPACEWNSKSGGDRGRCRPKTRRAQSQTVVLEPCSDRGDEAEHDTMSLGDEVQASPIAANGHVIIRSKHKLHCWH